MTKCEIVIVKYGLPELEAECVASVEAHTEDVEHALTVHDNYDADESLSKVWNDLIRASDAEYICLLNNDTRVEPRWLSKLLECFDDDDNLAAVGPMTNQSTGPQGNCRKFQTKEKRVMAADYPLVGFCLVFPKRIWEEVGGFDEGYEIYGEDSDFCMEIQKLGYVTAIRTDVFIFHHGKSSQPIAEARGKDILALKKRSKERFISKWHTPERKAAGEAKKAAAKARAKEERAQKRRQARKNAEEKAEARIAARAKKAASTKPDTATPGVRRYGK